MILRVLTSMVELIVAMLAYVWAGWPGVALYVIGAVLIGTNRALVSAWERR